MKYLIILMLLTSSLWGKEITHKVKKGEFLYKIASKYLKQSSHLYIDTFMQEIKEENKIKRFLSIGQRLKIKQLDEPIKGERLIVPDDFKAKALYFPPSTVAYKKFLPRIKKYRKAGINAVVVDVKTMTGEITLPFNEKLTRTVRKRNWVTLGDLNKLVHYLHKEDLYVIVRVVCFHDQAIAKKYPKYRIYKNNTDWVDPRNKTIQKRLLTFIERLTNYPVDEIQLDYVRFPAGGRKICKRQRREATILGFLKKVHSITTAAKIPLSLDVFGITLWQRRVDLCITGQNLPQMAQYAEVLSPMIYPSHFSNPFDGVKDPADHPRVMIDKAMMRAKKVLGDQKIVIRPYLQAFSYGQKELKYNATYIRHQLAAVNGENYLFWNARGKYGTVIKALTPKKHKIRRSFQKTGDRVNKDDSHVALDQVMDQIIQEEIQKEQ